MVLDKLQRRKGRKKEGRGKEALCRCFSYLGWIWVHGAGGRQLPAETRMCFRARGQGEGTDGGLPAPRGAAQVGGGQGRVAEGEETERGVKSRCTGDRCLWVTIQGRGQGQVTERGLDGGVAPRALQTWKTAESPVTCHNSRPSPQLPAVHVGC